MAEIIVALDVNNRQEAVEKVKAIGDSIGFYKIGLELFSAEGPDVVKAVKDLGKLIFLDLKLHDIPRTVERAVKSGARLGVDLMTIHSVGGKAMIKAAADAAAEFGANGPKILAVTVLTSLDQNDLADVGIVNRTPAEQVMAMAKFATENGMDFRGKDELLRKVKENGTMLQLMQQVAAIALVLAAKYEPMTGQQIQQMLMSNPNTAAMAQQVPMQGMQPVPGAGGQLGEMADVAGGTTDAMRTGQKKQQQAAQLVANSTTPG